MNMMNLPLLFTIGEVVFEKEVGDRVVTLTPYLFLLLLPSDDASGSGAVLFAK